MRSSRAGALTTALPGPVGQGLRRPDPLQVCPPTQQPHIALESSPFCSYRMLGKGTGVATRGPGSGQRGHEVENNQVGAGWATRSLPHPCPSPCPLPPQEQSWGARFRSRLCLGTACPGHTGHTQPRSPHLSSETITPISPGPQDEDRTVLRTHTGAWGGAADSGCSPCHSDSPCALGPGLTSECFTSSPPEGWMANLPSTADTGRPSFSHVMSGSGLPLAVQGKRAWEPSMADRSGRPASITGGTVGTGRSTRGLGLGWGGAAPTQGPWLLSPLLHPVCCCHRPPGLRPPPGVKSCDRLTPLHTHTHPYVCTHIRIHTMTRASGQRPP